MLDTGSLAITGNLGQDAFEVALTPDNLRLYAAIGWIPPTNGQVNVYDFRTGQWVASLPGSTGNLAMAPDGKHVYTIVPFANATVNGTVNTIDTDTNAVVAAVSVGRGPARLYVHPLGTRLWVVNQWENTISIIDTIRNRVALKLKLAANPVAIAFSPDGTRAYISENNANNLMEVIETSQYNVVGSAPLAAWSPDVTVSADGSRVYCAQLLNGSIEVLDATTLQTIDTIPASTPFHIQLSQIQFPVARVYVDIKPGDYPNSINSGSSGNVTVAILSTTTFDAVAEISPTYLRFGRAGTEAAASSCQAADVNNDSLPDLVCQFSVSAAGFQPGDTVGLVTGILPSGQQFQGQDSVRITQ